MNGGRGGVALAAAVLVAGALCGCSNHSRQASDLDAITGLGAAEKAALVPVLEQLTSPTSDRARLYVVQQRLIQECMEGRGFDYLPPPYSPIMLDLSGGFQKVDSLSLSRAEGDDDPVNWSAFDESGEFEAFIDDSSVVEFSLPDGSTGGMQTGGCWGDSLREMWGADLEDYAKATMIGENLLPNIIREAIEAMPPGAIRAQSACADSSAGSPACIEAEGHWAEYIDAFRHAANSRLEMDGYWVTRWLALLSDGQATP